MESFVAGTPQKFIVQACDAASNFLDENVGNVTVARGTDAIREGARDKFRQSHPQRTQLFSSRFGGGRLCQSKWSLCGLPCFLVFPFAPCLLLVIVSLGLSRKPVQVERSIPNAFCLYLDSMVVSSGMLAVF